MNQAGEQNVYPSEPRSMRCRARPAVLESVNGDAHGHPPAGRMWAKKGQATATGIGRPSTPTIRPDKNISVGTKPPGRVKQVADKVVILWHPGTVNVNKVTWQNFNTALCYF